LEGCCSTIELHPRSCCVTGFGTGACVAIRVAPKL
jgi:hypothetical protein